MKRASLKLPYKPEDFGFEMLSIVKEGAPDDQILTLKTKPDVATVQTI